MLRSWALIALVFAASLALGLEARAAAGSDIVTAARLGVYQGKARFVLEMTGKVPYQVGYEAGPDRIVLSFPAFAWHPHAQSGKASSGLIAGYHYAAKGGKAVLTLDLRGPAEPKDIFFIPPQDSHDWRFVVDVGGASKGEFAKRVAEAKPQPEAQAKPEQKAAEAKPAEQAQAPAPPRPEAKAEPKVEPPKPEAKLAQAPPQPQPPKPQPQAVPPAPQPAPVKQAEAVQAKPQPQPQPQTQTKPAPPAPQAKAVPQAPAPAAPDAKAAPSPPAPVQMAALTPSQTPPKPAMPAAKPQGPHKFVVVIDPGHGGVDPGAQATDGTKEKDVVFKVGQALGKKLEHSGRYVAVLTRTGDNFLKLSERVDVARQAHAELFISLHADTLPDSPDVSGTSVYTLSGKATDKEAEALAGKENRADIIAGVDLSHEPEDVTHILIDLAQRETANHSTGFAHSVAVALASWSPTVKNATRQAGFRVLKAPDVPSVLIELGYLSNKNDLARITSDSWIDQFTDAIVASVDHQFQVGEGKVQRVDAADRATLR
jgi:N-acetylmuramoyl-L-alanine amidase